MSSSVWGTLLLSAGLALAAAAPAPLQLNLNADSQFAPARACLLPADISRRQKGAHAGRKPVKLSQKDFNMGPYVIDKPGRYVLSEDVEFMPSSAKAVRAGTPQAPPVLGRCMRAGGTAVNLVRLKGRKRGAATEAECLGLCLKKNKWLGGCQFSPATGVCHGVKTGRGWWSPAVVAHHGDGSTAAKCWTAAALRHITKATPLRPTAAAFLFPTPRQLEENTAYALGFFAAIIVTADDVVIDLGGHTLAQSKAHALMQRFFSLIELADSPFPADKGPAHFSSSVTSSNYVTIMNGRLGRSSHHAIHGNSNSHVTVKDLEITDFEVSGVHLNKASCLRIGGARKATRGDKAAKSCGNAKGRGGIVQDTQGECFNVRVHSTRRDVAVNGQFSAALNLVRFAYGQLAAHAADPSAKMPAALRRLAASDLPALERAVVATINQVLRGVAVATMFATDTRGLPDGSLVAGIVVHPELNVGGYWDARVEDTSLSVHIENVGVANLAVNPAEILALKTIPKTDPAKMALTATPQEKAAVKFDRHLSFASPKVLDTLKVAQHVHDLFGSVFDVGAVLDRETLVYSGDAFSNMQVALAAYKAECMAPSIGGASCPNIEMLDRHNLDASIVAWTSATDAREARDAWVTVQARHTIQDGHDFMHHMNKGAVAIKVDGVTASSFHAVAIDVVENHAGTGRRPAAIPCIPMWQGYSPGCFRNSDGDVGYKATAPYLGWDAHAVTLAAVNGFTGRSYEASTEICSVEGQHFAEHSVINPITSPSLPMNVGKASRASTTTKPVYHGLVGGVKPLLRPRRGSDDALA
jgi:hypothetical protein